MKQFKPGMLPAAGAALLGAVLLASCAGKHGTLESASHHLDATSVKGVQFSATGKWFQFGQAPAPGQAWPAFEVSAYAAEIHYEGPAARVQLTRKQIVEPGRERPAPVDQQFDQYVSGGTAWNAQVGQAASPPTPQPAAVEERQAEIWTTPQGFLRAALGANAQVSPSENGSEVRFELGGHRYAGLINKQDEVERVQTWISNPVLGDALDEVTYTDYKNFGGLVFPARIQRSLGGFPVLDITVSDAAKLADTAPAVPAQVAAAPAALVVESQLVAPGVFYLRGGTHHSVAIEQAQQVVVVEAPQNEERSNAVIAKVKELIPGKPIRFVVNTHQHFDHSGGLRSYVDEGATVVTHAANRAFYEAAWTNPRTLQPDRLAKSGKAPVWLTFTDRLVLDDARHPVEIHPLAGNGHNDAFALVYLPKEKLLIEADAYTPAAAGATPAPAPNPYSVNLYRNVQRLKLDVAQIAALHGPGLVKLQDLKLAIGEAR